jgi:hypothetical protein
MTFTFHTPASTGAVLTPSRWEQSLWGLTTEISSTIPGVTNSTVLAYAHYLNANNFRAVADLFTIGGALQPPFQQPVVGREQIFYYLQSECQHLTMLPEKGLISYQDDGLTRLRVTGKVQAPCYDDELGRSISYLLPKSTWL